MVTIGLFFVPLFLGWLVINTHLVKTPDVSLVSTEDGSEQGNVHPVVTIPAKRGRVAKERSHLYKSKKDDLLLDLCPIYPFPTKLSHSRRSLPSVKSNLVIKCYLASITTSLYVLEYFKHDFMAFKTSLM